MNKRTKNGVEGKRHHHERNDVDQITPSRRSATSFGSVNVVFRNSLEIIVPVQNRKTNLIANVGDGAPTPRGVPGGNGVDGNRAT